MAARELAKGARKQAAPPSCAGPHEQLGGHTFIPIFYCHFGPIALLMVAIVRLRLRLSCHWSTPPARLRSGPFPVAKQSIGAQQWPPNELPPLGLCRSSLASGSSLSSGSLLSSGCPVAHSHPSTVDRSFTGFGVKHPEKRAIGADFPRTTSSSPRRVRWQRAAHCGSQTAAVLCAASSSLQPDRNPQALTLQTADRGRMSRTQLHLYRTSAARSHRGAQRPQ